MNEYEIAVLNAIAAGPGSVGWYVIERKLSNEAPEVREYLPDTLKRLSGQELIEEDSSTAGRFKLTPTGHSVLLQTKGL
jgi:RIO-like serine/threonine protein kinase